jgi:hypothetical protein
MSGDVQASKGSGIFLHTIFYGLVKLYGRGALISYPFCKDYSCMALKTEIPLTLQ